MTIFLKTSCSLFSNVVKTLTRERINSKSCVYRIQEFSTEETSHAAKGFDLGDRYSAEERNVILEKINTGTMDDLKGYKITESRLKRITAYRDKHGYFKSVEEILLFQGIDTKVLETFCRSLLKEKTTTKRKILTIKGEALTPPLNDRITTELTLRTFTGIWIWGNLMSWAQIDSDCNLLRWKYQSVGETTMKDGVVAIVEGVARVVSQVPRSDVYILESDPVIPFSRMNGSSYFLQLQRQQIMTTIVTILGTREQRIIEGTDNDPMISNVHIMRSRTPARLFDLLIGSEMVSAKEVVAKIIGDQEKREEEDIVRVHVNPTIKNYYRSLDIYEREQMNWALLLTAAFLDLYVLKVSKVKNISGNRQPRTA